jgi:hypothetical protein
MSETNYISAERYVLLPGFFNVIERGTRIGNTLVDTSTGDNFYDDNLTTQIVKDTIQLDLVLYDFNTSGSEVTINRSLLSRDLNKSVGVFLAKNDEKTGILQLVKYLGEYENFEGGNGRLSIDDFESDAAYKDAFVHFYYCNPADQNWQDCWDFTNSPTGPVVSKKNEYGGQSDSYDRFSIRPKTFQIESRMSSAARAGNPEILLTLKALDEHGNPVLNYNEPVSISSLSPTLDYNISKPGCITKELTIANDVNFSNGVTDINLTYSGVGELNITLHEVQGTEFAQIDLNDTDFSADIDDSDQSNNDYYREITPDSLYVSIIPHHFEVNATLRDHHVAPDVNFTYIADDYNMSSIVDINITAMNEANQSTPNYNASCYAATITDMNISFNYNPELPSGISKIYYRLID